MRNWAEFRLSRLSGASNPEALDALLRDLRAWVDENCTASRGGPAGLRRLVFGEDLLRVRPQSRERCFGEIRRHTADIKASLSASVSDCGRKPAKKGLALVSAMRHHLHRWQVLLTGCLEFEDRSPDDLRAP